MRYDIGAIFYFIVWLPFYLEGHGILGIFLGYLAIAVYSTIADRVNGYRWFWWIRGP